MLLLALFLTTALATGDELHTFLTTWCLDCHESPKPKGDLDLRTLMVTSDITGDPSPWREVLKMVETFQMPPDGKPQPPPSDRAAFLAALSELLPAQVRAQQRAGRVGPRRLNRIEYTNTVRDLLGIDVDVTDRFPADEIGHGFDTNAQSLTLPPLLLEKYFDAAESIGASVITLPDSPRYPSQRYTGDELETRGRTHDTAAHIRMPSRAEAFQQYDLPRSGQYTLRLGAWGQQISGDPVKVEIRVGETLVATIDVPATHDQPGVYEVDVAIDGGRRRISAAFINDKYQPKHPDPKERDRNCIISFLEVEGPHGDPILSPFQASLPVPGVDGDQRACLEMIASDVLRRAWRRPVTTPEIQRLADFATTATQVDNSFEAAVQTLVTTVLVSPEFLFRFIENPEGDASTRSLSSHELASRLSYFLWSSMPDAALLAAADADVLMTPKGLHQQIDRMLDDPRSVAIARHFATQWLQIRTLPELTPDPRVFPGADTALLEDMQHETVLLFDDALRRNTPIHDLLTADWTFLNGPLAQHYGIEDVQGQAFRRVPLPTSRGILGHASILTATSNPTRTSPVRRGKWVLEALLDQAPDPPPPGLDGLVNDGHPAQGETIRQLMERHRADPSCSICHRTMDELGFAMEHFDGIGRWRDVDHGVAIDARADLPGKVTFEGITGLTEWVIASRAMERTLARRLLTYALGRGVGPHDQGGVDQLVASLHETPTIKGLIHAIADLDAFQMQDNPQEGVDSNVETRR